MRTFLVPLLVAVAIVLVPLADLGVWAQRELVSTASFVNLSNDVLQQHAVRGALAQEIVADIAEDEPALASHETELEPIVADALAEPALRPALDQILATTHDQLRDGHDPLELDLSPLLPVLRERLAPYLASGLPSQLDLQPVTVLQQNEAPELWDGVQLVQQIALVLPALMLLVLVGAVLLARRRGAVCVVVGLATTVIAVGLVALLEPGRSVMEHQTGTGSHAAFLAGYDTVTRSFVQQTVVLAVLGVLLALGGLIATYAEGRRVHPSGWA
ncbi:MAG TPA: hypothetical protein VGU73_03390 [Acidimicrobiia bacterium]|nr:hypothetical protein [Acidimicrobiia bacterium]